MPFQIVRNDLTKMTTDAIVNTSNPYPAVGSGTDNAVYEAAGQELLLEARMKIGNIERGEAFCTPGFNLPAKYIIHTVGPRWLGGKRGEEEQLRNCYRNSLKVAGELNCGSISFPLISSGNYGFPREKALSIAVSEISSFLLENEMDVYLVVYDHESFKISSKLFAGIKSFIDENYVVNKALFEYEGIFPPALKDSMKESDEKALKEIVHEVDITIDDDFVIELKDTEAAKLSLADFIAGKDESFQNKLQSLIAERNLSNTSVYKKANMDKKLFSKIICTKNYVPKKINVFALIIALELSIEEAEDLLKSAGYSFSSSDKFDLVIKYFILQKKYDVFEINNALFELEQPLLGGVGK